MYLSARYCVPIAMLIGLGQSLPAASAERIGVVLIHGKQGLPRQFESYETPLAANGYLAERPEMCWSRSRIYDRPYLDCLRDIDAAIERLKGRGVTALVVVGMSLGGNAALAYGARRKGLKGIVALAPAHPAELLVRRPDIAASIAQARAMVAKGQGDARANFAELNTGRTFTVTTTAKIYLSFHGANSPAVMPANAARLTAPLLYVAGDSDRTQRGRGYVFARAPSHPLNRYVTVHSDHRGTPAAGRDTVMRWLAELNR